MTVQPNRETSTYIQAVTLVGDFIGLNLVVAGLFLLYFPHHLGMGIGLLEKYLAIANICYATTSSIFRVQLHQRFASPERIIGRISMSVTMYILLFIGLSSLLRIYVPRGFFLGCYLFLLVSLSTWRISMRFLIKHLRSIGRNSATAVIVGGASNARELYEKLTSDPSLGYRVLGVFDDEPLRDFPPSAKWLGHVSAAIPFLRRNTVDTLFCSLPSSKAHAIVPLINHCENNLIHFYSVPNIRNYLHRRMKLELFDDIPILSIREEPLQSPFNKCIKRAFDLFVSTVFLCTVYPFVYLFVGIGIKLTSPGPIYFKQKRSGENGRIFQCLKFRSMRVNDTADTVQATANDPRKTRFGEFLRHSNLDELPQFINVWKGEMSLVGPRPHMLMHTEMYSRLINKYMVRHLVKPGITGWAQVTGFRGETKELSQMEGRVRRDIWYIENWSFLLDLRILYLTVRNIIKGDKQAY